MIRDRLIEAIKFFSPVIYSVRILSDPEMIKCAALEAFISKTENEYSEILRQALVELKANGFISYS